MFILKNFAIALFSSNYVYKTSTYEQESIKTCGYFYRKGRINSNLTVSNDFS